MGEFFLILISTSLVNNLVLDSMLGTSLLIAVSRKADPALDLGLMMLIVMPVVTVVTQCIEHLLIIPLDIIYLRLIILVVLIPFLVLLTVRITGMFSQVINDRMQGLISLVIVNSTVLGTALLAYDSEFSIARSLFFGIGTALGFTLILVSFTAIREKVSVVDVPQPFQGIPILIVTLGLIAMAFMGFIGISAIP